MISDTSRPIFSASSLTVKGPDNSISVAIAASALRSASAFVVSTVHYDVLRDSFSFA